MKEQTSMNFKNVAAVIFALGTAFGAGIFVDDLVKKWSHVEEILSSELARLQRKEKELNSLMDNPSSTDSAVEIGAIQKRNNELVAENARLKNDLRSIVTPSELTITLNEGQTWSSDNGEAVISFDDFKPGDYLDTGTTGLLTVPETITIELTPTISFNLPQHAVLTFLGEKKGFVQEGDTMWKRVKDVNYTGEVLSLIHSLFVTNSSSGLGSGTITIKLTTSDARGQGFID